MSTIQVAMVGITGMLIALQFKEVKKEYLHNADCFYISIFFWHFKIRTDI